MIVLRRVIGQGHQRVDAAVIEGEGEARWLVMHGVTQAIALVMGVAQAAGQMEVRKSFRSPGRLDEYREAVRRGLAVALHEPGRRGPALVRGGDGRDRVLAVDGVACA